MLPYVTKDQAVNIAKTYSGGSAPVASSLHEFIGTFNVEPYLETSKGEWWWRFASGQATPDIDLIKSKIAEGKIPVLRFLYDADQPVSSDIDIIHLDQFLSYIHYSKHSDGTDIYEQMWFGMVTPSAYLGSVIWYNESGEEGWELALYGLE